MQETINHISAELEQNIDRYSQGIVVAQIGLLLSYCERFYGRQFITRKTAEADIPAQVERLLEDYLQSDTLLARGLPTVQYLAEQVHLSPGYLGDLLRRETGRSAQDHIHFALIEAAKEKLLQSRQSVNEIAYALGFEYPQYFSKLFKQKTGMTPRAFRQEQ